MLWGNLPEIGQHSKNKTKETERERMKSRIVQERIKRRLFHPGKDNLNTVVVKCLPTADHVTADFSIQRVC